MLIAAVVIYIVVFLVASYGFALRDYNSLKPALFRNSFDSSLVGVLMGLFWPVLIWAVLIEYLIQDDKS